MEKIENPALKELFELNCKRIQTKPKQLYQCVNTQFCDPICRVGFQREYAPPKGIKPTIVVLIGIFPTFLA